MRYAGDIPETDRVLIEELQELERWFYKSEEKYPLIFLAKCLVAIAHDYYIMELEEEGDRILADVEKICPGYFKGPVYCDMDKDGMYDTLINNMKKSLAIDTMRNLGFEG